ncbi:MAG: Flp family type IVb pilin [Devosia sp.]|jgi:pilus assembly protein Flp/PilA
MSLVERFARNESGATAIEYGLIAALMAVACIAAFEVFGSSLQGLFQRVSDTAGNAMANSGS